MTFASSPAVRRGLILTAVLALGWTVSAFAQPPDGGDSGETPTAISRADAIRLREFFRLLKEKGDEIWPGFAEVPAPVLLVTPEGELLIGWDDPAPEGFEELRVDPRLGRSVRSRPAQFPPGIEASFPAFGPPAVIVFGPAEATDRSSAEWVLTLLHEHLHQLQYAAPEYYAEVDALDLAGSDTSGMWMLEYPFPYEDEAVGRSFAALATALRAAVARGDGEAGRETAVGAGESGEAQSAVAWTALRALLARLEPADARYLSFQLWQEGVGRYVELRGAEVAAHGFVSSPDFAALPDTVSWAEAAGRQERRLLDSLESVSLAVDGRTAFYPVGAALAVLLDRVSPEWKSRYVSEKFALDRYLDSDAGRRPASPKGEAIRD